MTATHDELFDAAGDVSPVVRELMRRLGRAEDGRMVFVAPVAEVVPFLRAVRDEVELRRLAVDLVNLACVLDTRARSHAAADEVLRLAVRLVPQLRVFLARDRDWGAARRMAEQLHTGTHAGAKAALSDKPAGFGVGLRKR